MTSNASIQQRFASKTSLQQAPGSPPPRPFSSSSAPHLPLSNSDSSPVLPGAATKRRPSFPARPSFGQPHSPNSTRFPQASSVSKIHEKSINGGAYPDEEFLLPARIPPRWYIFDLFPFSLLVKALTKRGKEVKGKTAAKLRAKLRNDGVSHNLPLEISLYLVRSSFSSFFGVWDLVLMIILC